MTRRNALLIALAAPFAKLARRPNRISNIVVAVPCEDASWVVDKEGVENWYVPRRPPGITSGRVFDDLWVAQDEAWNNPRPVRINLVVPGELDRFMVRLNADDIGPVQHSACPTIT